MPTTSFIKLQELAEQQHGMVTLEQVDRLGGDRSEIAQALVEYRAMSVIPGVVQIAGNVPEWELACAYWLRFAPEMTVEERLNGNVIAVAAAGTAAHVWDFANDSEPVFIPLDPTLRVAPHREYTLLQASLTSEDWCIHENFPVTKPLRSLVDALLKKGLSNDARSRMIVAALETGLVSEHEANEALEPHRKALFVEPSEPPATYLVGGWEYRRS